MFEDITASPTRVLVVDDNVDLVAYTLALLRTEGHEVQSCYDGSKAMGCVLDFDPDVVVLDIGLPGKSGLEVARAIRRHIPGKRPMIIGATGEFSQASDEAHALINGFDFYLTKPVDPELLLGLVGKAPARR